MLSCLCYAPGHMVNVYGLTVMNSTTCLAAAIGVQVSGHLSIWPVKTTI